MDSQVNEPIAIKNLKIQFYRLLFLSIWLILVIYTVIFSSMKGVNSTEVIFKLLTFDFSSINPITVAIYNLMGIWPIIYLTMLYPDGKNKKVPSWPFLLASFLFGIFIILPYFVLRDYKNLNPPKSDRVIRILNHKVWLIILLVISLGIVNYGLLLGNFQDFLIHFQSNTFVHIMTIDFIALTFLSPFIIWIDSQRYLVDQHKNNIWILSFIPLIGTILYTIIKQFK